VEPHLPPRAYRQPHLSVGNEAAEALSYRYHVALLDVATSKIAL
jgi:hypothetical protein